MSVSLAGLFSGFLPSSARKSKTAFRVGHFWEEGRVWIALSKELIRCWIKIRRFSFSDLESGTM
jgi:hypothetical protein